MCIKEDPAELVKNTLPVTLAEIAVLQLLVM
jgi:hypothetical protein